MDRRRFLSGALILAASPLEWPTPLPGESRKASARFRGPKGLRGVEGFPLTAQLSPVPGGAAWTNVSDHEARAALRFSIGQILDHGFTGLEYPFHLPADLEEYVLEYARSQGIFLTYNHTFEKGGVENFGRDAPPPISVYAEPYADAIRKNLVPVLAKASRLPGLYNIFCYMDEPFHAGPQSFDFRADARREFHRRYGYEMPPEADAARMSPKEWLDLINFQSDEFPAGWRQVYKLIKASHPELQVVLTHDSHSAMGAGVGSNSRLAVDDIFHWGADFADAFVFDIYPYMMFDYRYGEMGKLRKPRLSQLHFAFAQLRNLTHTYGKGMGFWFGTYNRRWFSDFMGPELKVEAWAEVEVCYTAVGQGADFLISGYEIPEDSKHWDVLGRGLQILQQTGPALLRCPKAKARASFLFPRTQYIQLQQEYWNVGVAYDLFRQAFGELDCLHEEQIRDSFLDGYDILVLFDVQLLPEAVAGCIAEFVKGGGIVIADCIPSLDAYRKPMSIMGDIFGVADAQSTHVQRSGMWVASLTHPHWFVAPAAGDAEDAVKGEIVRGSALGSSYEFLAISPRECRLTTAEVLLPGTKMAPALTRKKSGKGQAFLLGFCMQDTFYEACKTGDAASRAALVRLLRAITTDAGVVPNIFSSNPDIEACLRTDGRDAYVLVVNHEAECLATSVHLAMPQFRVREIFNFTESRRQSFDRAAKTIRFDIEVPRERPQLLRLLGKSSGARL
jgi:hypothetical protein